MEVTPRFFNMTWRAIGIEHSMTCDDGFWMERLDFVERSQPLIASFSVAFSEI